VGHIRSDELVNGRIAKGSVGRILEQETPEIEV
jgi:hypothetical protein